MMVVMSKVIHAQTQPQIFRFGWSGSKVRDVMNYFVVQKMMMSAGSWQSFASDHLCWLRFSGKTSTHLPAQEWHVHFPQSKSTKTQ